MTLTPGQQALRPSRLLRFLYLHPRISPVNFATFLLAAFFAITFFVLLNSATTFVLSEVLGFTGKQGDIVGALGFYDELLSIVMVMVWGVLSDRVGRRLVYAVGFLFIAMALFFYSAVSNIYPQLLLVRLLFAVGASACAPMLTAVLADCAGKLRGRISGLVGLMSSCGALLAVGVLLPLPTTLEKHYNMSLGQGVRQSFYITGGLALLVSFIVWVGLSKSYGRDVPPLPSHSISSTTITPPEYTVNSADEQQPSTHIKTTKSYLQLVKAGVSAAKDMRVLVAYMASFAARGNTIIVTTFLPLWVNQYYISNGLCNVGGLDPNDKHSIQNSCRQAFTKSSTLSGVTQLFALLGAPIWGILFDRFGQRYGTVGAKRGSFSTLPIMASCIIAFIGYLLVFFIEDPRNQSMYGIVFLVGFGEIGTTITSVAIVAEEYVDPEIRGSVAGVYSLIGAIGILVVTRLGGTLFDSWKFTAPFILIAIVHILVAALAAVAIAQEIKERKPLSPMTLPPPDIEASTTLVRCLDSSSTSSSSIIIISNSVSPRDDKI